MKSNSEKPPVKPLLLRERDLPEILRLSRATIRRLVIKENFPRAIKLGGCVVWKTAAIEAWIDRGCNPA